ncbi:MAG: 50S ribosomal protein L27 [Candidatus Berkelbacteria bacterium]
MAHTKAKGTSKLGRDSRAKRLGVKIFGGQTIEAGQIIVRQRGSKFYSGEGTAMGADDTLYAKVAGKVNFKKTQVMKFTGSKGNKTIVSVS